MVEMLFRYYGVDILAMLLTFAGIYLIGNKKRLGFTLAFIGNALWMIYGVWMQAFGLVVANVVIAILNVRGYVRWR